MNPIRKEAVHYIPVVVRGWMSLCNGSQYIVLVMSILLFYFPLIFPWFATLSRSCFPFYFISRKGKEKSRGRRKAYNSQSRNGNQMKRDPMQKKQREKKGKDRI